MALANEGWGYTKIRDALVQGLKIEIGRSTVADILKEAGIEPAPEREKERTWKRFMKMHWDTLCFGSRIRGWLDDGGISGRDCNAGDERSSPDHHKSPRQRGGGIRRLVPT